MNLGLDLSLTETGWYALAPGIEEGGVLKPGDKLRGVARLRWLRRELCSVLAHCNKLQSIERVVVEGYAFGAKNRREEMGEWGGVARLVLADANLTTFTMQPTSLKQFVTGKGNAQKDEMMLQIFKRWGREFANNNVADAFALSAVAAALGPDGTYHAIFGNFLTPQPVIALQKVADAHRRTAVSSGKVRERTRKFPLSSGN